MHRIHGNPAIGIERIQHIERTATTQLRPPPAKNQLLGLYEKFHLADAAAPKLDVVSRNRDLFMPAHGVNLPLHGMNIGNGSKVEIFAPDKRFQSVKKTRPQFKITRNRTRFDQSSTFPVLPDTFIIGKGRIDRDRNRGGCRIGAQPQIGAQHIPFPRALLHQPHKSLRQSHKK